MKELLERLLHRAPASPPPPRESERLLRVYQKTEADMRRLRRAA